MGANPPKHDAWRPYTDFIFVLIPNRRHLKPHRGVILQRPHRGDRTGRALVLYRDDTSFHGQEWKLGRFARDELILVPVDPNWNGAPRGLENPRGVDRAVLDDRPTNRPTS